jgi:hypothetical protein
LSTNNPKSTPLHELVPTRNELGEAEFARRVHAADERRARLDRHNDYRGHAAIDDPLPGDPGYRPEPGEW